MKKGIILVCAFLALTAICYIVTCYVSPFLGLFAIGGEVYILDKINMGLK